MAHPGQLCHSAGGRLIFRFTTGSSVLSLNHEGIDTMNLEETIDLAKDMRDDSLLDDSLTLLLELLDEYPDDPLVLFEVGGAYDLLGMEKEAIPFYDQAVDEGLDELELQECLICLGSCYRAIGEFSKAIEVLEQATQQFPEHNSGRAFLALAYYAEGKYEKSVQLLLSLLLETSGDEDIQAYSEPLEYYGSNLNEVWES